MFEHLFLERKIRNLRCRILISYPQPRISFEHRLAHIIHQQFSRPVATTFIMGRFPVSGMKHLNTAPEHRNPKISPSVHYQRFNVVGHHVLSVCQQSELACPLVHPVHASAFGTYPQIIFVFGKGTDRCIVQAAASGEIGTKSISLLHIHVAQLPRIGSYPYIALPVFINLPYGIVRQAESIRCRMLVFHHCAGGRVEDVESFHRTQPDLSFAVYIKLPESVLLTSGKGFAVFFYLKRRQVNLIEPFFIHIHPHFSCPRPRKADVSPLTGQPHAKAKVIFRFVVSVHLPIDECIHIFVVHTKSRINIRRFLPVIFGYPDFTGNSIRQSVEIIPPHPKPIPAIYLQQSDVPEHALELIRYPIMSI